MHSHVLESTNFNLLKQQEKLLTDAMMELGIPFNDPLFGLLGLVQALLAENRIRGNMNLLEVSAAVWNYRESSSGENRIGLSFDLGILSMPKSKKLVLLTGILLSLIEENSSELETYFSIISGMIERTTLIDSTLKYSP